MAFEISSVLTTTENGLVTWDVVLFSALVGIARLIIFFGD